MREREGGMGREMERMVTEERERERERERESEQRAREEEKKGIAWHQRTFRAYFLCNRACEAS